MGKEKREKVNGKGGRVKSEGEMRKGKGDRGEGGR
jgi:hypothetical protein